VRPQLACVRTCALIVTLHHFIVLTCCFPLPAYHISYMHNLPLYTCTAACTTGCTFSCLHACTYGCLHACMDGRRTGSLYPCGACSFVVPLPGTLSFVKKFIALACPSLLAYHITSLLSEMQVILDNSEVWSFTQLVWSVSWVWQPLLVAAYF
jgi:hypothetical protein